MKSYKRSLQSKKDTKPRRTKSQCLSFAPTGEIVIIKWAIRIGGAAALGKKLYDGMNPSTNPVLTPTPADNTHVVVPSPMLYTPGN